MMVDTNTMLTFRNMPSLSVADVREELVIRSIRTPDGCWEWLLSLTSSGYGAYRRTTAHQAAYRAWIGEVPEGLELDHLCRNRKCCNPAHLEVVTHLENMRRGAMSLRTHCPRGHPYDISRTVRRSNGYTHQTRLCSQCDRETMARYREEHRAELREYKRKWDIENPEKLREYRQRQQEKRRAG